MSDFAQTVRRQQRIIALLESYEGQHVKLVQLCVDLRLDPENDLDIATLVSVLSRMEEGAKVQKEYKDRTIYYWIDPPPPVPVRSLADAAKAAGIL